MLAYIFSNKQVKLDYKDIVISIFIFSFGLYFFNVIYSIQSDMSTHIVLMIRSIFYGKGIFYIEYNSFLKISTYILSFFNERLMIFGYVCSLSLSLVLKYIFLRAACIDYLSRNKLSFNFNNGIIKLILILLCISGPLILFTQVINNEWSIDVLKQNPWHNPTTVALTPFAFLLFYFSFITVFEPRIKNYLIVFILFIFNLLIKPNFLMVWMPMYFMASVFLVITDISHKNYLLAIKRFNLILFLSIVFLGLMYFMKDKTVGNDFCLSFIFSLDTHISRIRLDNIIKTFFEKIFLNGNFYPDQFLLRSIYILVYKPLTLIGGLAFPIGVFFFCKQKKDLIYIFAWFSVFFAIIIDMIFSQTAEGFAKHLNFSWQIPVCVFMLFFISTMHLIKELYKDNNKYLYILFGLFFIHAYSGVLIIQRIIFIGDIL